MTADNVPIDYGRDTAEVSRTGATIVEFVGGPRDGERAHLLDPPTQISEEKGTYRRSVRCADDDALRYVYDEDPVRIAHRRVLRPC